MKGKAFRKVAKLVSLVITAVFLLTSMPGVGLAATTTSGVNLTPDQIAVPEYMGSVVKSHKGTNGKMVVHIQDLHCNYDAQMSHASILEMLTSKGVKLIMNEGKWSNKNLQHLKGYVDSSIMETAGQNGVREGYLNGASYFELTSDADIIRRGVEDKALYTQGAEHFFKMRPLRGKAYRVIRKLNNAVDALKGSVYSKELKEYDTKRQAYKKGDLSTSDYYNYISSIVTNIDAKFPNTSKVVKLVALESKIDFIKVNTERDQLIEALNASADEKGKNALTQLGTLYRDEKISSSQYYKRLLDLANTASIEAETSNLAVFAEYMNVYEGINFSDLSKEQDKVERQAGLNLCLTQDQKDLFVMAEKVQVTSSVVDLKVTRDEFNIFMKDHNVSAWVSKLNAMIQSNGLSTQLPTDVSVLEQIFPVVTGFYQTANKRDEAYIKNINKNMQETGENVSVLISGGFHTDRVTEMLQAQGYSYVVISPRINTIGTDDVYHKNMATTFQALHTMQSPIDLTEHFKGEEAIVADILSAMGVDAVTVEANDARLDGQDAALVYTKDGKLQIIVSKTATSVLESLRHEFAELAQRIANPKTDAGVTIGTGKDVHDVATAVQSKTMNAEAIKKLMGISGEITGTLVDYVTGEFSKLTEQFATVTGTDGVVTWNAVEMNTTATTSLITTLSSAIAKAKPEMQEAEVKGEAEKIAATYGTTAETLVKKMDGVKGVPVGITQGTKRILYTTTASAQGRPVADGYRGVAAEVVDVSAVAAELAKGDVVAVIYGVGEVIDSEVAKNDKVVLLDQNNISSLKPEDFKADGKDISALLGGLPSEIAAEIALNLFSAKQTGVQKIDTGIIEKYAGVTVNEVLAYYEGRRNA